MARLVYEVQQECHHLQILHRRRRLEYQYHPKAGLLVLITLLVFDIGTKHGGILPLALRDLGFLGWTRFGAVIR
jgi:hypothetical protein